MVKLGDDKLVPAKAKAPASKAAEAPAKKKKAVKSGAGK